MQLPKRRLNAHIQSIPIVVVMSAASFAQAPQSPGSGSESAAPALPANTQEAEPPGGKRVFGVLPNYRTADASQEGNTLTSRQKFNIAAKDSFDWPLVLLSGALAGLGQLTDQDP